MILMFLGVLAILAIPVLTPFPYIGDNPFTRLPNLLRIKKDSVETEGLIFNEKQSSPSPNPGFRFWTTSYNYTDKENKTYLGKYTRRPWTWERFDTSSKKLDFGDNKNMDTNKPVTILYEKDNPENSAIKDKINVEIFGCILFLTLFTLFLIEIGHLILKGF